jgi:GNAT superfamily N-acetyltransferase
MDVRPLSAEHVAPLEAFFRRVPESDHNSFAEDVLRPGVVESWLSETRPRRAVAVDGDLVVGYVALLPLHGWSAHVGSLRVVTDPEVRGKGVGAALIEAVKQEAGKVGVKNVYWMTHETNTTARKLYDHVARRTGFIEYDLL